MATGLVGDRGAAKSTARTRVGFNLPLLILLRVVDRDKPRPPLGMIRFPADAQSILRHAGQAVYFLTVSHDTRTGFAGSAFAELSFLQIARPDFLRRNHTSSRLGRPAV